MPPLDQSLSSSQHSIGNTRIFSRVRNHLALSPTRNNQKSIHNSNNVLPVTNFDAELRTAKDACIGAMMALLHYLSQHNIASGSCVHELHQTIPLSNHYPYDVILRRIIQQYLSQMSKQKRNDEFEIIHMLVLGCWQTQFRYAQVQHQKAYRIYHNLRFYGELQPLPPVKVATMNFATVLSATPQLHHSQLSNTNGPTTNATIPYGERNIETALRYQIQMAEYVCTCQKEIILCNRTYEHQQCYQ